jgi:hypothetical protein
MKQFVFKETFTTFTSRKNKRWAFEIAMFFSLHLLNDEANKII